MEKRILESDRRGKNDLKKDSASFERQCLRFYMERQPERNAPRPAANELRKEACVCLPCVLVRESEEEGKTRWIKQVTIL